MIDMENISVLPPSGIKKDETKNQLKLLKRELFKLQNKFYADGRFSLLIILQ